MNASASAMSPSMSNSTGSPAEELRGVVAQAERLLSSLESSGEDTILKLRDRARGAIDTAKTRLRSAEAKTRESVRGAAIATDDYVHEKPWQTVGYAAVFGLIVGALLARRF